MPDLLPDTRRTVALMSLYHRLETPLCDGNWPENVFGLEEPALAERGEQVAVEGVELAPERLLVLTALLRFLDACDVQADRVVNKHYAGARELRTREETGICRRRLEEMAADARHEGNSGATELQTVVARVGALTDKWDREAGRRLRQQILEAAVRAMRVQACPGHLVALGLADGILFKLEQEAHFLKHGAIQCVHLASGNPDGHPGVGIHLLAQPEDEETVREVAAGIWKEYAAARVPLDPVFLVEGVFWNDGRDVRKICP